MSSKIVTLLLLIVLGMALVHGQNESTAPATGKAVSADVTNEDIQYDANGKVISKTTIKGISIKDTGTGGTLNPNYGVVPVKSGKSSPPGGTLAPGITIPYVAGSGSVQGTTTISKIVINIVTLRFLVDLGILKGMIDPMEGFTRLLLLILLFALLFRLLSGFNLVGKGTAVAIALVIALMTVIFIPGSVLLAIGASYGTLFSLILMLVPIGLGFAAYWFLKDYPWIRVMVMLLLWWILTQMENYIMAWTMAYTAGNVVSGYGVVILGAVDFIKYVKWIIFALLIVNLLQALFKSSTGHSGKYSNNLKNVIGGMAEKGYKNFKNKAPRAAKNLLREHVEEEKELKLLGKVDESVKAYEVISSKISTATKIETETEKKSVTATLDELKKALTSAEKEMKTVTRKTWRAESKFGHLLKELRAKNYDTSGLEGLENNILKKHKECAGHLEKGSKEFDVVGFKDQYRKYHGVTVPSYPVTVSVPSGGVSGTLSLALGEFGKTVGSIKTHLASALAAETEAKKDLEGVISKAEEMLA